jgi:hypothetical protein
MPKILRFFLRRIEWFTSQTPYANPKEHQNFVDLSKSLENSKNFRDYKE